MVRSVPTSCALVVVVGAWGLAACSSAPTGVEGASTGAVAESLVGKCPPGTYPAFEGDTTASGKPILVCEPSPDVPLSTETGHALAAATDGVCSPLVTPTCDACQDANVTAPQPLVDLGCTNGVEADGLYVFACPASAAASVPALHLGLFSSVGSCSTAAIGATCELAVVGAPGLASNCFGPAVANWILVVDGTTTLEPACTIGEGVPCHGPYPGGCASSGGCLGAFPSMGQH